MKRIRPERQDRVEDRVTALEVFQHMFTPEMMNHIVQCTHARVELIKNNEYPKPGRAKVWPPKWADMWQPLTEARLIL